MLAPSRRRAVGRALSATLAAPTSKSATHALSSASTCSSSTATLPSFLVPALRQGQRGFSSSAPQCSKLGRTPLSVPPGVEITIGEPFVKKDLTTYLRIPKRIVNVKGPLGSLDLDIPMFLKIEQDPATRRATLSVEDSSLKQQREMWGTKWAYLQNYITGVSEGHTAVVRLVGIGFRASVEDLPRRATFPGQKTIVLKLGYTHPIELLVPEGVTASTPNPTRILLEGIDREAVMSFAGKIRLWRKPEPYKGKGVFINDETIKLKQKKIK